jgi:hypothetical protein
MRGILSAGLLFPVFAFSLIFPVSPDTSLSDNLKFNPQVDYDTVVLAYAYQISTNVPQVRVMVPGQFPWSIPFDPCYGTSLDSIDGGIKRWEDTLLVVYKDLSKNRFFFRYFNIYGNPISGPIDLGQPDKIWCFKHPWYVGYQARAIIFKNVNDSLYILKVDKNGIYESQFLFSLPSSGYPDVAIVKEALPYPPFQTFGVAIWADGTTVKAQTFDFETYELFPLKYLTTYDYFPVADPNIIAKANPEGFYAVWRGFYWTSEGQPVFRGCTWVGDTMTPLISLPYNSGNFRWLNDALANHALTPYWIIVTGGATFYMDPEPNCTYGGGSVMICSGGAELLYQYSLDIYCREESREILFWKDVPDTFYLIYLYPGMDPTNQIYRAKFPILEDPVENEVISQDRGSNQFAPQIAASSDDRLWVLWKQGGRFYMRSFNSNGDPLTELLDLGSYVGYWGYNWFGRELAPLSSGISVLHSELLVGWFDIYSLVKLEIYDNSGSQLLDQTLCEEYGEITCMDEGLSSSDDRVSILWTHGGNYLQTYEFPGNLVSEFAPDFIPEEIQMIDSTTLLFIYVQNDSLTLQVFFIDGSPLNDPIKVRDVTEDFHLRTDLAEPGKVFIAVKDLPKFWGFFYYWPEDYVEPVLDETVSDVDDWWEWDAAAGPLSRAVVVTEKTREGLCGTSKDIWIITKNFEADGDTWLFKDVVIERGEPDVELVDNVLWIAWKEQPADGSDLDVLVYVEPLGPTSEGEAFSTSKGDIRLISNPARGNLLISVSPGKRLIELDIYDVAGRRLLKEKISGRGGIIKVPLDLPTGKYFLRVGRGKETIPFVFINGKN